jgi:integrase
MPVKVRKHPRGWLQVDISGETLTGVKFRRRVKYQAGKNRDDAKRWGEKKLALWQVHGPESPEVNEDDRPTLAEYVPGYLAACKANGLKRSTLAVKVGVIDKHLLPRFGGVQLHRISAADFTALKVALAGGERPKAAKTINNVVTTLSGILRHARDEGVIETVPTVKLVKVHREAPRHYDRDTLEALVAGARRVGPREELLVLLGADAGLREGEIAGLVHADLDLGERPTVHVRRTLWQGHEQAPKGGRDRKVPCTPRLAQALSRLPRPLRGRGEARVLTRDDGRHVTAKWIEAAIRRIEGEAGLPKTGGCHVLRHTFCSLLVVAGAHPRVIQKLAGHADLSTTLRYMHLAPDAGDDAISALGLLAPDAPPDGATG